MLATSLDPSERDLTLEELGSYAKIIRQIIEHPDYLKKSFSQTTGALIRSDPWYGYFLNRLRVRFSWTAKVWAKTKTRKKWVQVQTPMPTMAVAVEGTDLWLIINPLFWAYMSLCADRIDLLPEAKEYDTTEVVDSVLDERLTEFDMMFRQQCKETLDVRCGCLKHELLHIVNHHLTRLLIKGSDDLQRRMTIAGEVEVNQYISDSWLWSFAQTIQLYDLPAKLACEEYVHLLPKMPEPKGGGGGLGAMKQMGQTQEDKKGGGKGDSQESEEGQGQGKQQPKENSQDDSGDDQDDPEKQQGGGQSGDDQEDSGSGGGADDDDDENEEGRGGSGDRGDEDDSGEDQDDSGGSGGSSENGQNEPDGGQSGGGSSHEDDSQADSSPGSDQEKGDEDADQADDDSGSGNGDGQQDGDPGDGEDQDPGSEYDLTNQDPVKGSQPSSVGGFTFDDHRIMTGDIGEVDVDDEEIDQKPDFKPPKQGDTDFDRYIEHKVNGYIQTATDEFQAHYEKHRGTLPGEIEQALQKMKVKAQVPWEVLLEGYISDQYEIVPLRSFRRSARRHEDIFPGKKLDAMHRVVVATDSSGSVSDDELKLFVREIDRIVEALEVPVKWVQCDAMVHDVLEYEDVWSMKFNVRGRGGTDFQPIIDYCVQERVPHVVLFTDGECPQPEYRGIRVIWVFTPRMEAKKAELLEFKGPKVFMEWPPGHPLYGQTAS